MKVFIDARMVGPPGGIARYVSLLAEGLRAQGQLPYRPVFIVHESFDRSVLAKHFQGFDRVYAKSKFLSLRELVEIPRILKREGAQAFHSPSFSSYWSLPCPHLVTPHDLNHLQYGGRLKQLYYRVLLKRFCQRAKVVTTVSEFSRAELGKWLGWSLSKIEIVPNAFAADWLSLGQKAEDDFVLRKKGITRGNYFLTISSTKPHKNLGALFEAYEIYRATQPDRALPLVATVGASVDLPSGVRAIGAIEDQEAKALIRGCAGFFFPSLYEGFGLPPVEAALLGAPVVLSRIPSHSEAFHFMNASEATWLDPRDIRGWVKAFTDAAGRKLPVASETSIRKTMEGFSVHKLGSSMDRIYRHVLGLNT